MTRHFAAGLALLSLLSACATSSVTPVSKSQFLLSTSAAPACGMTGASRVAGQMAAVETVRRGYPRFVILGAASQNNVDVIQRAPTYATTTGTFNSYGNMTYGNTMTQFGGGGPMIVGSNDTQLRVLMLKPGDQGYGDGLDAKALLGPDWAKKVKNGVLTCTG